MFGGTTVKYISEEDADVVDYVVREFDITNKEVIAIALFLNHLICDIDLSSVCRFAKLSTVFNI